jgi:hypothetical protein
VILSPSFGTLLDSSKLGVRTSACSPFETANIAELRSTSTCHMSAPRIMLYKRMATITSFPPLHLRQINRSLQSRVLRTIDVAMVRAATGRAGSVSAFWTFRRVCDIVDVLWCYPGTTGWLGAVDSVAYWNGPFCFTLVVFFCSCWGKVGEG